MSTFPPQAYHLRLFSCKNTHKKPVIWNLLHSLTAHPEFSIFSMAALTSEYHLRRQPLCAGRQRHLTSRPHAAHVALRRVEPTGTSSRGAVGFWFDPRLIAAPLTVALVSGGLQGKQSGIWKLLDKLTLPCVTRQWRRRRQLSRPRSRGRVTDR